MTRRALGIAVGVAAVLVAGCGTELAPAASTDIDGDWRLVSASVDGRTLGLLPDAEVTLLVEGNTVSGRSACNMYGGTLSLDADRVTVGGLGGTEMACEPHLMTLEQEYVGALPQVTAAARTDSTLTLTGAGVELSYEPIPPVNAAAIVGTHWVLESVLSGSGADASVASPMGDPVYLAIRADGSLIGSTGCRTFDGAYAIVGGRIDQHDTMMSFEECPADLVTQDNHIATVIGDGFSTAVAGDRLTISDPDGSALEYRAAGPFTAAPTVGSTWTLTEASVDQGVLDPGNDEPVTLVYDGSRFSGSLGCNSYFATAAVDGSAIVVSGIESTARSCPDNASRERTFLDALRGVETFDRVGDSLLLRGGDAYLRFGLAEPR